MLVRRQNDCRPSTVDRRSSAGGTIYSYDLGDRKKIGRSRWARLKQICDTLMLSVENGVLQGIDAVSVRQLDALIKEIESLRSLSRPKHSFKVYTPEERSAINRRAAQARWAKNKKNELLGE